MSMILENNGHYVDGDDEGVIPEALESIHLRYPGGACLKHSGQPKLLNGFLETSWHALSVIVSSTRIFLLSSEAITNLYWVLTV
jgi:hypothetical protein